MDVVHVIFTANAEMRRCVEARKHADRQTRAVIIFAKVCFKLRSLAASSGCIHVEIKSGKSVIANWHMSIRRKNEWFAQALISQYGIQLKVIAGFEAGRQGAEEINRFE